MRAVARRAQDYGLWSMLCVLAGALYWVEPNDLIPDNTPYFGYLDDVVLMVVSLVAAWFVAPASPRDLLAQDILFRIRVLRADLANFGTLQHRYVDGFIISGKNSGSHWLKYMLSHAMAEHYELPLPTVTSGRRADEIVGRADRSRCGRKYPQIATSHTIPSILLPLVDATGLFRRPPIVLLVRDIRAALLSNYVKWQDRYAVEMNDFARGDPAGRKFIADVWWYVHFFNRWSVMLNREPSRILLLRYEDMLENPAGCLARAARHLGLALREDEIAHAAAAATKDRMRALQDENAGETIIPAEDTRPRSFSRADEIFIRETIERYLRKDLTGAYQGISRPA